MYYLYIVRCADETLYTGVTTDLKRRTAEHNKGTSSAKYTRGRGPVALVYSRRFRTRANAQREEARIKKLSREQKISIINNPGVAHGSRN